MLTSNENIQCVVCSKSCESSCGACKKVAYCGKVHQKSHWKEHKPDCFPAIVQSNDILGRHLVATRTIKQGEIVFREKTLVSGPNGSLLSWPICLSCYRVVQTDYLCSKCKWPLCGPECEQDSIHFENECSIFAEKSVNPFEEHELYKYESITVLRGVLLLEKEPSKWKKILDLQSHAEERSLTLKGKHLTHSSVKFIQETCGLKHFDEDSIDHVLGALGVNAFVSDDGITPAMVYRNGSYLYYNGSMPAHSCVPNSSWAIQPNSEFLLRASVVIKPGEKITQLYAQPILPTRQRRKHLLESKYFSCECSRCIDPSELGTYFGSIKCPGKSCTDGYLSPVDPLKDSSEWQCNLCSTSRKDAFVVDLVGKIRKEINSVGNEDTIGCIEKLENILKKHKGLTLHPNHFIVHEIENDILQRCSYLVSAHKIAKEHQEVVANRLINLSQHCISVADVIWPGFNRQRGRLLYFLQQGMTILLVFQVSKNMRRKTSPSKSDLLKQFENLLQLRNEVLIILAIEPEGREESYIAKQMAQDSLEIKILKKHFQMAVNL